MSSKLASLVAILFLMLSGAGLALAQEAPSRFPVDKDGAWGYIDSTGQLVIAPQFDEATPFSDGWARVKEGEAFKFIDAAGEVVLEPDVEWARPFSEGLAVAPAPDGEKLGYIDKAGQFVIAPQFEEAYAFSEGRAAVYTGTSGRAEPKYGYIDQSGKFVIEPQFWGARRFSEGLAPVLVGGFVDGTWGFVDESGEIAIEPQFEQALPFAEGLAAVSAGDGFDARWGYVDRAGQVVIEPTFELARSFSGGRAPVEDVFDDWRYIGPDGEPVSQEEYAAAEPFAGGLARVASESSGSGYGSQGGTMQFFPGVADANWRYIDQQGRQVWPKPSTADEAAEAGRTAGRRAGAGASQQGSETGLPAALPGGLERRFAAPSSRGVEAVYERESPAAALVVEVNFFEGSEGEATRRRAENMAVQNEGFAKEPHGDGTLYAGDTEEEGQLVVYLTDRFLATLMSVKGDFTKDQLRAAFGAIDLEKLEALAATR